jgi:hypothetical protein
VVERIRHPATAESTSATTTHSRNQDYTQKGRCDVRASIDHTHQPLVGLSVGIRLSSSSARIVFGKDVFLPDIEGKWERKVSTIRTGLIPAPEVVSWRRNGFKLTDSLHSSANGTQDDGEEERLRLTPLVKNLVANGFLLEVFEAGD